MCDVNFFVERVHRIWNDEQARKQALGCQSASWGDRVAVHFGVAHLIVLLRQLSETPAGKDFLTRLRDQHACDTARLGLQKADVRVVTQIIRLYLFDRRLRLLMWDGIKGFETGLRARLSDEINVSFGNQWLNDPGLYDRHRLQEHHDVCAARSRPYTPVDQVLVNKRRKLALPRRTLSPEQTWFLFSKLYFGDLVQFYAIVDDEVRANVASCWQCKPRTLNSWLKSFHVLRNMIAHHNHLVTARSRSGAFDEDAQRTGHRHENRRFSDAFQPPEVPAKKDRAEVRALYDQESNKTIFALVKIVCYTRKLQFSVPTVRRDVRLLLERNPAYWPLLGIPQDGLQHPVFT